MLGGIFEREAVNVTPVSVEGAANLPPELLTVLEASLIENGIGRLPVLIGALLAFAAGSLLTAASLGFLGIGVQPPTPEWGAMLGEGRNYIFSQPSVTTFPGLAIFLAVVGFNLLGDGLRDALDPQLRGRK